MFASPARKSVKALQREYELRGQLDPEGPQVKLLHLAYQAASHELATKTFDFSPSSVADRWTAGRRDMASGLDLIAHANRSGSRFSYLPVDAGQAAKSVQRGALMAMDDRRVT